MEGNNMGQAPESSVGPVIATIIILAVIVLGGLYFWGQRGADMTSETVPAQTQSVDETTAAIESQSSSDDTSAIDADLRSTDTTSVDSSIQGL
ncbi:MAG: hypothetical protein V4465_01515 [Patescibacteria group bacterium]